jgi:hypothetical protein
VAGPNLVAAYPQTNENAWLLGQAAMLDGSFGIPDDVGLVGARGLEPTVPTSRIVAPSWIADALVDAA